MGRQEITIESEPSSSADAQLVERVRQGDVDAVRCFFDDHYPGIYRYLLWLTERPELAEDLTQETFIRAWGALDRFDTCHPLRPWLHQIARREFLRAVRSRHPQLSLDAIPEPATPHEVNWMEAVEVREAVQRLPHEEREMVVLHYLQGYNSAEIARIMHTPAGTVRYRLSMARERLERELGEGDLYYLNERPLTMRQWAWLPLDQMYRLETRLLAQHPIPNTESEARQEDAMERREFLRNTAMGAVALMLPEAEKEVVDDRLRQKVTCAFKGTALADVCDHLRTEMGVRIAAGPSIADEKVTLFCEKLPLREVMRQLSRPFGYTWLRKGKVLGVGSWVLGKHSDPDTQSTRSAGTRTPNTDYGYELVQDLRSQLLEEELRNRDRNAALLALEQEIEKYRPYLDLTSDEARERAKTAPPEEKQLLENYARFAWGPVQLYFRLSPQQLAALRAGQPLMFSPSPEPGQYLLPPELAQGVLESQSDTRFLKTDQGYDTGSPTGLPGGLPLTALPEARAVLTLMLGQTDLGQFTLSGGVGYTLGTPPGRVLAQWQEALASFGHNGIVTISDKDFGVTTTGVATGQRPTSDIPKNEVINARLARDPALRQQVTVAADGRRRVANGGLPERTSAAHPLATSDSRLPTAVSEKVTTADVLEALHHASGVPIVADFYTRLYPRDSVSLHDQPLFRALNEIADSLRLRWHKEGDWLQFRSVTFYHDRLKEVPNRLLAHWAASRRLHEILTPDDLIEIAQLTDAQLDAEEMAVGARECWGLTEWDLARVRHLRPHLRFLGGLTPEQRWEAMRPDGLAFTRMSLPQQQQFLALTLGGQADAVRIELEDLAHATLQVRYYVPHGLQWQAPDQPDGPPALVPRPAVDAGWAQRFLAAIRRRDDQRPEEEIVAGLQKEPDLEFTYLIGTQNERPLRRWVHVTGGNSNVP